MCVNSIGGYVDNNSNNLRSINDDETMVLLEYTRKLIELDNSIRRRNFFTSDDEKLIEDIILYNNSISNISSSSDSTISSDSSNSSSSLSYEEKIDIIYKSLDTKWAHNFYLYDDRLEATTMVKGWVGRKMIGSNCIVIERAVVTRYYKCEGCIIEEALGCLSDLRQNVSGNVPSGCNITFIGHLPGVTCCPQFGPDKTGKVNLIASTSGYPEALRCIQNVGCSSSEVYSSLLEECQYTCPLEYTSDKTMANITVSDQNGNDACLANFNAGRPKSQSSYLMYFIIALVSLIVGMT